MLLFDVKFRCRQEAVRLTRKMLPCAGMSNTQKCKIAGRCIFCSSPNLTKEHIWPKWLEKHIAKQPMSRTTHRVIRGVMDEPSGIYRIEEHRGRLANNGDPISRKLRVVCGGCNNGWMSVVTNKARPFLRAAIFQGAGSLSPLGQEALAKWAVLFTMVNEFASPEATSPHASQRASYHKTQTIPKNWLVWIGTSASGFWDRRVHRAYVRFQDLDQGQDVHELQTTTLALGRAFFHVCSCTSDSMFANIDADEVAVVFDLFRIWPVAAFPGIVALHTEDLNLLSTAITDALSGAPRDRAVNLHE